MPLSIAALAFTVITLISVIRLTRRTVKLNREAEDNWSRAAASYEQAAADWAKVAELNRQAARARFASLRTTS